jgi:ribosomal protein S17
MMKSVTVAVTRMFRHARLDKTVRETKKYMVRVPSAARARRAIHAGTSMHHISARRPQKP